MPSELIFEGQCCMVYKITGSQMGHAGFESKSALLTLCKLPQLFSSGNWEKS